MKKLKIKSDQIVYKHIVVVEDTHTRTAVRASQLKMTYDQLQNYLLDCEKQLLTLKKK
jgi:hypothetical protein